MNIKRGPWTVTSSEIKYKNPWIEVREDAVIRPDGKPGIFGVTEIQGGVNVLPYDDEGNVYLIEEYQYAMEQRGIEVPGGGIDGTETTLEAAQRELSEEVGLTSSQWTDLGAIDPLSVLVRSRQYLYLARGLRKGDTSHEGTETIKLVKVPFGQAVDWVMDGTIKDPATIALVLKTVLLLQKEN